MNAPRRTQEERHAATHEALLTAAVAVVARKGAYEATLQDVAEAAGVSKGALTYHFKSKDDLLDEVLSRCAMALRTKLAGADDATKPPLARSRLALKALREALSAREPEAAALVDLVALGRVDARLRGNVGLVLGELSRDVSAALVGPRVEAGLVGRVPAAAVARFALDALFGAAVLDGVLEDGDAEARGTALSRAVGALFDG